jgi:transposase InsO family protein
MMAHCRRSLQSALVLGWLELGCDNGEKVRVTFALDCCAREAMGFVATTEGIKGEDVRELTVTAVEHRSAGACRPLLIADRQRLRIRRPRHEALCS